MRYLESIIIDIARFCQNPQVSLGKTCCQTCSGK